MVKLSQLNDNVGLVVVPGGESRNYFHRKIDLIEDMKENFQFYNENKENLRCFIGESKYKPFSLIDICNIICKNNETINWRFLDLAIENLDEVLSQEEDLIQTINEVLSYYSDSELTEDEVNIWN